ARGRSVGQAGGRPLVCGRPAAVDPGQGRAGRRGSRRRAHRGVPRRHADRRAVQPLRPPERADREGRIGDRRVTWPWHGYYYRLEEGCAPPPYSEKLVTYRVRVARGVV